MPYKVIKSGRGFYVENKETGRRFSNSPIPKSNALAQMRALYAHENGYTLSPERKAYYSARRSARRKSAHRSLKRSGKPSVKRIKRSKRSVKRS
jgi:hypothetical protein